jgi:hypothetical protein
MNLVLESSELSETVISELGELIWAKLLIYMNHEYEVKRESTGKYVGGRK